VLEDLPRPLIFGKSSPFSPFLFELIFRLAKETIQRTNSFANANVRSRNSYFGDIKSMVNERMLTTPEVADRLGISTRRVLALIYSGRLPSQQFGRDHLVKESDLNLVEDRKPGRPRKAQNEQAAKRARKKKGTKS
jgi:excisionase family DNA binding protein